MFSEKDIAAYKSITAPSELKEKVMSAGSKTSNRYQMVWRMVACLAVILGISTFWDWNHSGVSVQQSGQEYALASQESRTSFTSDIRIKITTDHQRNVRVTQGVLKCYDPENGSLLESGNEIKVKGSVEVSWEFDSELAKEKEMRITGWGKDRTFLLQYDEGADAWIFSEK